MIMECGRKPKFGRLAFRKFLTKSSMKLSNNSISASKIIINSSSSKSKRALMAYWGKDLAN